MDLIVQIRPKQQSDIAKVKFHLLKMLSACPTEPGCKSWKVFENSDGQDFFIIESWESEEMWKGHMRLDAFKEHYENGLMPLMERDVYFMKELTLNEDSKISS